MSEVDVNNGIAKLREKVTNEVVKTATRILKEEGTTYDLLRNSIREITAYPFNRLPCPAYMILDGSRKLELIGNKFKEIVDASYCMNVAEVKISILGLDEQDKPAASVWIQLNQSFHSWEFYLWDKTVSGSDYLVLLEHGTTVFCNQDEDLRFTLEHHILDLLDHKFYCYVPL